MKIAMSDQEGGVASDGDDKSEPNNIDSVTTPYKKEDNTKRVNEESFFSLKDSLIGLSQLKTSPF